MMAPETTVQKTNTSVGVNVTTETRSPIGEPNLNPGHFTTIPGILKLVQLVLGIICMACASPVVVSYVHFFMFVAAVCFIGTICQCFIYLFSLQKVLPQIPWPLLELLTNASAVLLYLVATIVQLAMTTKTDYYIALSYHNFYGPYVAAGVMALFNTIAYGALTFFLYTQWRASSPATTASTAPNGNAAN